MKYIITLFLLIILTSCSKEVYTVKKARNHIAKTEFIAEKLFKHYEEETYLVPFQLKNLLNESELKFLTKKLRCPYIHIIYSEDKSTFFKADSVVIFTNTGIPIIGKQHNIILDMRISKRDSIPVNRSYLKYYKVLHGVYYVQDFMPEF